jgi:hypothetical protein
LQELAGHSTSKLTERYVHRRLDDLAGAVGKIPAALPGGAYLALTKAPDSGGGLGRTGEDSGAKSDLSADVRKTLAGWELSPREDSRGMVKQEAPPGFEPGMADLQSAGLAVFSLINGG